MTTIFRVLLIVLLAAGAAMALDVERPSDAHLHAYKCVHHAEYLKITAEQAGGTNRLIHTRRLPTEGNDPVVTPALDHLYSKAVIDLTEGPVFLTVPPVPDERYFSIHVTDQEHYTIYDEIRPQGRYVLVRRGREDEVPDGAHAIVCRGDYPHLFVRTQFFGGDDLENVVAVQDGLELTGTEGTLDFDDPLVFTLATHDVYPQNAETLAAAEGYGPDDHRRVFDFITDIANAGLITSNMGTFGPIDSDEQHADDPVYRAAGIVGHLGLPVAHAYYPAFFTNCRGEVLNGDNVEVFTFPYRPQGVRGFWSVTRYSQLTRNTLPDKNDLYNAYNTEPDTGGNVTITFSAADPGDGTYWMPVNPGEPYYFVIRYYEPDVEALPAGPCP